MNHCQKFFVVALLVFAGCVSKPVAPVIRPQVATPPLPMKIIMPRAVEAPTAPVVPKLIELAWDYPVLPVVTFEVWSTTNLFKPFTLKTNTAAKSVKFSKGAMEFYKVRARAADGQVSDWATTR